jgi:hypothetical protein
MTPQPMEPLGYQSPQRSAQSKRRRRQQRTEQLQMQQTAQMLLLVSSSSSSRLQAHQQQTMKLSLVMMKMMETQQMQLVSAFGKDLQPCRQGQLAMLLHDAGLAGTPTSFLIICRRTANTVRPLHAP